MRTAIYIEDGVIQLVLTPESDWEKQALGSFKDKPINVQMFSGAFYDCRGGWTRQTAYYESMGGYRREYDTSLILRIGPPQAAEVPSA